ncbi:hypothetical protein DZ860_16955 [Vibrio sinensis]|uniref:Uncharacterized protein n=1 Tax=Vibrio sinensis TaxID=2302434 RepID=A0A3A6QND6_9VIBR|nr:hypothetical protein [Vibrio sinensis]RJX68683.1 hypothetical protein DZ860_16955 [Vibrio sinensis]
MYEKTDKLCPNCFRWLRLNQENEFFYCPDTIKCRLSAPRIGVDAPKQHSIGFLKEELIYQKSKAKALQDLPRIERLKEAIARFG